ncbi:MAG: hypothetical protein K0S81_1152, partial [Rhodospirillales bacterium]|nr:hypothetical protein [Rhodospirillales bacterium]
ATASAIGVGRMPQVEIAKGFFSQMTSQYSPAGPTSRLP